MPTVLIIDDNCSVRKSLAMMLESGGWNTLQAESGAEGLDKARQTMPNMILCDLSMPRMDGVTTLRKMRSDPSLEAIPVLIVSGRCDASEDHLVSMGAQGLLLKPFRLTELLERADLAIRGHCENRPAHAV